MNPIPDELIKAQNELIGVLFEIIKRLQSNNDLDTEYFKIIGKDNRTENENLRLNDIKIEKIERSEFYDTLQPAQPSVCPEPQAPV